MAQIKVIDGALCRLAGSKSAAPLVFFPVFCDSGHCYKEVFSSALSERYHLIDTPMSDTGR